MKRVANGLRTLRSARVTGAAWRCRVRSRKVVAVGTASALLIGLVSAGAQAGTEAAVESSVTPSSAGPLDVTVGKTVALTTDQNGNKTPFSVMLLNGQVSGQGTGQVSIPTGPSTAKKIDVSSAGNQVHNFFDLGGMFAGEMPVSVVTSATVNGKKIDPNQGYDLTGDVEITYTFTNRTSRQQTITYQNIYGKTTQKQVDVPVPFGDSFEVIFGDGWSIRDNGSMTMKTTPAGAVLSSTVLMFPIIEGLIGGTTQTLKIKAMAERANLPATSSTVVPVPFGTYESGMFLEVAPAIQQRVLEPLNSTLDVAVGEVRSVANMISGYTAGFGSLATNYIDPLARDIESISINPNRLQELLERIVEGLKNVAGLMAGNRAAQDRIGGIFDTLAELVSKRAKPLVKWLGKAVETLGPESRAAARALKDADEIFSQITDPGALTAQANEVRKSCNLLGPTSNQYGYKAGLFMTGGEGATAVAQALKDAGKERKKPSWIGSVAALQGKLDDQSAGALIPKSLWLKLNTASVPAKYQIVKKLLLKSSCGVVAPLGLVVGLLDGIWASAVKPKLPTVIGYLDELADVAASPIVKRLYEVTLKALDRLATLLSNDKCTDADIVEPILSAVKKYGAAGLKSHIVEVLQGVFADCGVAQVIRLLGRIDGLIGVAMLKLAGLVKSAEADIPIIVPKIKNVQSLTAIADHAFDSIPGLGQYVADLIGGYASKYGDMGEDAIGKVSSFASELQATLEAMNARVKAGDGAPYGNATGPNTRTFAAYQVTQQEASPYGRTWSTAAVLSLIFLLLGAGLGTVLYRRRSR